MLRSLVWRAFEVCCLLVVAYAFVTVPVGRRTGWGHLIAIFSTRPAHEAAEDVHKAGADLGKRLLHGEAGSSDKPGRR
jgi:hypothetical protein